MYLKNCNIKASGNVKKDKWGVLINNYVTPPLKIGDLQGGVRQKVLKYINPSHRMISNIEECHKINIALLKLSKRNYSQN